MDFETCIQTFIDASGREATIEARRALREVMEAGAIDAEGLLDRLQEPLKQKHKRGRDAVVLWARVATASADPCAGLEPLLERLGVYLQTGAHSALMKVLEQPLPPVDLGAAGDPFDALLDAALWADPTERRAAQVLESLSAGAATVHFRWTVERVARLKVWLQATLHQLAGVPKRQRKSYSRPWSGPLGLVCRLLYLVPRTPEGLELALRTLDGVLAQPGAKGREALATVLTVAVETTGTVVPPEVLQRVSASQPWVEAASGLAGERLAVPYRSPWWQRVHDGERLPGSATLVGAVLRATPDIGWSRGGLADPARELFSLLARVDANGWHHQRTAVSHAIEGLAAGLESTATMLDVADVKECRRQGANPLNARGVLPMARFLAQLCTLEGTVSGAAVRRVLRRPWTDAERFCVAAGLGEHLGTEPPPGTQRVLDALLEGAETGEGNKALKRLWDAMFDADCALAPLPDEPPRTFEAVWSWVHEHLPDGSIAVNPAADGAFIPEGLESVAGEVPGTTDRGWTHWRELGEERDYYEEVLEEWLDEEPDCDEALLLQALLGEILVYLGTTASGDSYVLAVDRLGSRGLPPVYLLDHHGEGTRRVAQDLPALLFRLAVVRWGEHIHRSSEVWDWVEAQGAATACSE